MKKSAFVLAVVGAALAAGAADIGRVIVRQQWPWSTAINVDFELSGVSASAPADISLRCYNGAAEIPAATVDAALSGARYALTEGGTYTLTLDPTVLFPSGTKTVPDFRVTVTASATSAADTEVIYKIINLADGATTNLRRVDFYNNPEKYGTYETSFDVFGGSTSLSDVFIWTGVTNNPEYTSTKLVLRKIPAAGAEWPFGSSSSLTTARLTSDFWIGVFPLTQAQYYALKSSYGGYYTNAENYPQHERFPVTGVAWREFKNYGANPAFSLIAGRTGLTVDFPTEMQWEYAARGGASDAYCGYASADGIGWYRSNAGSNPMPVGTKKPNAFGLYDVVGNVLELCRDWYGGALPTSTEQTLEDYQGVSESEAVSGNQKVSRGGYFDTSSPTVYSRSGTKYTQGNQYYGVRVWAVEP